MRKLILTILAIGIVFALIMLMGPGKSGGASLTNANIGSITCADITISGPYPENDLLDLLTRTLEFLEPDAELRTWQYPIDLDDMNYLRIEIERYMRLLELRRDIERMIEELR